MNVHERIKQLRVDKGLKQGEAAIGIGVSQRMLSAIELGDNQPTLDTLTRISTFYGVSLDYIVYGRVDIPTPIERDILKELREDTTVYNALVSRVMAKKTILKAVAA